jgi:hypothetical protein
MILLVVQLFLPTAFAARFLISSKSNSAIQKVDTPISRATCVAEGCAPPAMAVRSA